jgi:hypothetical protein
MDPLGKGGGYISLLRSVALRPFGRQQRAALILAGTLKVDCQKRLGVAEKEGVGVERIVLGWVLQLLAYADFARIRLVVQRVMGV